MNPGKSKILICPHCGAEKEVMTLLSGNTFGGCQWSDTKKDYPMLPQVSHIQKCPKCGKYFFTGLCESREGPTYSFETGLLTYPELKEAYYQFEGAEIEDPYQMALFYEILYAYNDKYNRDGCLLEASQADNDFIKQILGRLIQLNTDQSGYIDPILKAEFLREKEDYKESYELLKDYDAGDPFLNAIASCIKERALEENPRVFRIEQL